MMKTFDEIYQELKTEDMQEINKLYECVKKKSKNQKRIALIICAIVDILILFLVSANLKSVFFSMFAIMFIFIIDTVIYVIITLISGFSKEYKELNTQYKNINSIILRQAIRETAMHRETLNIVNDCENIIKEMQHDDGLQQMWEKYRKQNFYAEDIQFNDLILALFKVAEIYKEKNIE